MRSPLLKKKQKRGKKDGKKSVHFGSAKELSATLSNAIHSRGNFKQTCRDFRKLYHEILIEYFLRHDQRQVTLKRRIKSSTSGTNEAKVFETVTDVEAQTDGRNARCESDLLKQYNFFPYKLS